MPETPNYTLKLDLGNFVDGLILKKLAEGGTRAETHLNWLPKGTPGNYTGKYEWVPVTSIHFSDEQLGRLSELYHARSSSLEGITRLEILQALECEQCPSK